MTEDNIIEGLAKLVLMDRNLLILEFVNDLKKDDDIESLFGFRLYIDKIIQKWEKKLQ